MRHPGILNDILFKIVFGTTSSEPVMRALVNALLELTGPDEIIELTFVNPVSEKQYIEDKGPIFDLKARDSKGRQYNVEVQLRPGLGDYLKRSIYYVSKFFSEQIHRGDSYQDLLKTVSISLLDFNLLPEAEAIHSTFVLREKLRAWCSPTFSSCTMWNSENFALPSPKSYAAVSNGGFIF